jgi:hypothetical protein
MTGLVIYKAIIEPKRYDTPFSRLLGFGVLLPFWIVFPTILFQFLGIRNFLFKFVIGVITPTLSIFRTTEGTYVPYTFQRCTWLAVVYLVRRSMLSTNVFLVRAV